MCFLIALLVLGGLAGVGYTVWRNKGGPGGPTRFATPHPRRRKPRWPTGTPAAT